MSLDPSDAHALAGAYALDALSGDERAAFEAHLPACVDCRREVDELTEVGARLGTAVEDEPPPDLRARVLEGAGQMPQEAPHEQVPPAEVSPLRRGRRS